MFRLKAEEYQSSINYLIKPCKIFSVLTISGSMRDKSWLHNDPKRFDDDFSLKASTFRLSTLAVTFGLYSYIHYFTFSMGYD
ncbi:MAG: hypothetical protein SV062_11590 [Thermodesulfobacteriota bacterium]|nr:hypothetical protein [Thermodesulfobacteriota bacterium]